MMSITDNTLIFDFELLSLAEFTIGQSLNYLDDGVNSYNLYHDGYSANITEGVIHNIFICFTDGYYDYKKFEGFFKKEGCLFKLSQSSSSSDVKGLFGEPEDEWNDEVELNLRFSTDSYQIEFSWNIETTNTTLTYICIESAK